MDVQDRNTQIIIGAVLLVVVIGGVWWVLARGANRSPVQTTNTTVATTTNPAPAAAEALPGAPTAEASGESVSVADQAAGETVRVSSVTLSERGWVAIRDDSGRTLGAALFPAGTQTDVSVPLLRATEGKQHYQVLLYFDNGDKQFDLHTDTLVVNSDGSVAGTTFTTE